MRGGPQQVKSGEQINCWGFFKCGIESLRINFGDNILFVFKK